LKRSFFDFLLKLSFELIDREQPKPVVFSMLSGQ
jgi:hypothetical protein